jgi:hypothetical protein
MKYAKLLPALLVLAIVSPVHAAAPMRLSLFVADRKQTAWLRFDPVTIARSTENVVARLPGPPFGARASWSADRKRGLVWFDPTNAGSLRDRTEPTPPDARERLYLVDFGPHKTRALPLPGVGKLAEVGFLKDGSVMALTIHEVKTEEDRHGRAYTDFEGKRYSRDANAEGQPLLAHAWRLEGEHWKRVETVMSSSGWDYAAEETQLKAYQALQYRAAQDLEATPPNQEVKDPRTRAALGALVPRLQPLTDWLRLEGPNPPVYTWSVTGEFVHATGPVVFGGPKLALAPRAPWGPRDVIAAMRRGSYLLLASTHAGTHPRLYDLRTRKLIYSDDVGRDAVFWPD